jgi:ABC-type Fe3+-hydroxamate transport system substrate-binding protein
LGSAPPHRIVSLNPTTTEILFAIGAGHRLAGRSQYDVFPDSATRVPSLGVALRPNIEAVMAVHPDLVILYASNDNRTAFDRLRAAGIAVAAFKIDSIEQFERDTRLLGRLTGDSARASALVDTVAATLARVRAATAGLPRPTVFIPTWDHPIIAIGGGSFMSELVDIAGARNIYADMPGPSGTVTLEDVVRRNPDLVITSPISAANMRSSAAWRTVGAVRAGRVLAYDTLLVSRPSVTLGAAARSLAELIHPGAVPRAP